MFRSCVCGELSTAKHASARMRISVESPFFVCPHVPAVGVCECRDTNDHPSKCATQNVQEWLAGTRQVLVRAPWGYGDGIALLLHW